MELKSRTRLVAGLIAVVVLAVLTWLSLWSVVPPPVRTADAPAGAFSAGRAFAHVQRIGANVHVAGSGAADDVRGYLDSTLRGFGLQTEVQDGVGATDELGGFAMARVRNLIAVLPGADSTGRVFLVAHYDSVQVSYGGNDDGAGVSAILETARALTQGAKPRNDIVFVLTDAEEACLCGAEAFVSQHPLAKDGGVVLNLEARGSAGPAIMFETSAGNADLVGLFGQRAPHPVGTSFAVEVYRILPNDTDFTPFRESGRFTGLNSAYIDGSAVYHTPQDKPSYMDQGSLQQLGDNALAMARALGEADLRQLGTPAAADATYFPALTLLVRYPGWLVWPVAVVALVLVGLLAVLARRRRLTSWPRVAAGFGLGLIPVLLAPVAAQLLWALLVAIRPGYAGMIDPWRPGWFRAGVVALVVAVLLTWYGLLRRRLGSWSLAIAALAWLAVLGLVLAAATPGGSYLAAIPALSGAVAASVAISLRRRLSGLAVLALGAAVAVLVLAPTVLLFFPALGLATGAAAALFAMLLGLTLLPVLDWLYPDRSAGPGSVEVDPAEADKPDRTPVGRRWWIAVPAIGATVASVVFVATGLVVDRFDPEHPAPAQLMYALDADSGQARWASSDADPGAWAGQFLTGREDLHRVFPVLSKEVATGPAQAAALPAPTLAVESDTTAGSQRTLTLRITPNRPVRLVALAVPEGVRVVRATVAGRDISPAAAGEEFVLLFHAPPPEGLTMTLVLDRTDQVRLRVMDGSDGLAGLPGFRPRPPDVGVKGSHTSELVLVGRTYAV
ncbi:MAG TPA: M28 family peptidase [Micromonosporaceae bacterium]